jgi:F-type H+-transporting ATPase subunit b
MSHLDDEIRELKAVAEKEAQEEYQRLLAEARQDAGKIIEKGRREIEGMTRAAQISLKAHVAELSVKLAEDTVRRDITNEDRARIFARFVTRLRGKE